MPVRNLHALLCRDFSLLVLLVQCFSSARKPFLKKMTSLRGPHQLHSEIIFLLTNTGRWESFQRMLSANLFSIPQAASLAVLPPSRQRELRGCVEMRSGWGQEWCHPSVLPAPQLLMYAAREPHELSNYWIMARSEVVTSKTEGDSPSPFVSPLGVRRTFFLQDLWEREKGCAR